ncbi:hypothetical protein F2Q70_00021431 [Brassica cretica]|uniref:Uncharacterized protein n=2 Tax=Brassica cretica TaxID=69181 RepID=A0A8S9H8Q9_BRACR|nr:hypothetical protein F2Q70_00021431 [Brassica cretica]KAF2555451.1 hypothetical protein F2Q68_00014979 [Brassica cretica]KAF3605623.1 hypothetical protein DY000_02047723 [Brassica cretica]
MGFNDNLVKNETSLNILFPLRYTSKILFQFSWDIIYVIQLCDTMTTRRKPSSRESKRIHSRSGVGGSDRIHYGDVSDALTEVLREETRLPRPVGVATSL